MSGTTALVVTVVRVGGGDRCTPGTSDGVVGFGAPRGVRDLWELAALGRGGDAAGGGRCSIGVSRGKGRGGAGAWWWCWWCHVPWLCVNDDPRLAWTCAGGGPWLGCRVRVLWYGGGGGRCWGWRCWCAPGVFEWNGAAWLGLGPGWAAAPFWRARWRAPDLSWSSWRGGCWGLRERACQRCASLRHASRPQTYARWYAGPIRAAVVSLGAVR